MKRHLLNTTFFLSLIAFAFPDLRAQTVQIGTGTDLPANTLYGPVYRYTASSTTDESKFDMLITAAEMTAAGIPAGATITAVEFNKGNVANFLIPATYDMYMANTSNTALATTLTWANVLASHTLVYTSASFNVPSAAGWVMWTLPVPFTYTGGAFEIAGHCVMTGGATGATDMFKWEYTATPSTATYMVGVTGTGATLSGSVAAYKHRPNIKITYIGGACTSPPTAGTAISSPAIPVCPGTQVTLNLTGSSAGAGQTYQWESSPTSGSGFVPEGSSQTFATLNVNPASTLFYRCAVTCSGSTTYSTEVQVQTGSPLPANTYTINSGSPTAGTNFQTFADALNAMKCGIAGPVIFDVDPGSGPYPEQISIPAITGTSATNTITFNGNGRTIQFAGVTGARHVIQLNGADYITFNNLRVVGLDPTYGWGIHLINDANHIRIQNCVIDMSANTSTTAANSAGIVATASATAIATAGNNTGNLTITGDTIKGAYQGIILSGDAAAKSYGNTITNNAIQDFYAYGIVITHHDSTLIQGNDINRATRAAVGTFEGVEIGTGCKRVLINANKIHDTHTAASAQTGTAYGIFNSTCDAPVDSEIVATNNIIYNFNSGSGTIYALYNSGSDGAHYYHNTIVLNNAASTAGVTRGFYQTTAANNLDLRNNIFYITRGGTGIKYCIYLNTTTTSITSNNNVLYINCPAGTNGIGYYTTGQTTLANWRTVNGGIYDLSSTSVDPTFVSAGTYNFTPTEIAVNNIGANVGIATDFAGNARGANPDPGAFEFAPIITRDAAITWIAPGPVVGTGPSPITVEIMNNGLNPITSIDLEYTNGITPVSETFASLSIPTGSTQQFTFTTPYNFTTGVGLRAYVKLVNGLTDATQANDSTTIKNFCIGLAGGTYTINSAVATGGGNFQTFTDAVSAMTGCGILGPVVFNVNAASGPYTEQITIPQISGVSEINTITFNGNGRALEFTPVTANRHIIKLDGADYVTINDLQLRSLSVDFGWGVHLINGANYNQITNCTVDMNAVTNVTQANSAGIVTSGSGTSVTTDGSASYNTISGNTFIGGYQGIIINGATGALNAVRNIISNNTIRDFYATGIELTESDSVLIEGNNIYRRNRVDVTTFEGIELGAGNKNGRVNANKIHDTHNAATTQSGAAYGIYSTADDAPVGMENLVTNNVIYNMNSTTGTIYGIYSSASDGIYYYHNTIVLDNATSTSGATRGIYQTTMAANVNIFNNIIYIARGGSGAKHCLYFGTATSTIASNNNLLYINAPAGTNYIGYYSAAQATLADWKAVNGAIYDQQSIGTNPLFNGPGNYRPNTGSPAAGAGAPLAAVTLDFTGDARSATAPTIGAYENIGDFTGPVITIPVITGTSSTANRTLTNIGITDISDVDTTNNKPRIYFKKSTDNNAYVGNTSAANGWKWTEALGTTNPFSFTIDYSIINGGAVAVDDVIEYFIVAQDKSLNPSVSISSGEFNNTPDSVDLIASAFPVIETTTSYAIINALPGGTYSVGASGTYLNLTAVADSLRKYELTGNVIFEIDPSYNGTTEIFPVVFNNIARSAPSHTVTIRPSLGVATPLVTEGDPGSGNSIIDLDQASLLTLDGRPAGVGDMSNIRWIIRNKRTAATFAPAIRFINDASGNTLQYLEIQSANTLTTSGTVLFSTAALNGNDNNIIQYNIIRDRADTIGIPAIAIYSAGTGGAANDLNQILNNRIFNWTSTGVSITANGNGDGWKINGNHFYSDQTPAASTAQTSINFAAATNNIEINNNYIGSNSYNASGSAWMNSGANAFIGITAAFDSLSTASVTGNVIRSIQKTATGAASLTGIIVSKGNANVMGNLIGDTVNTGSIINSGTGVMLGISITNTLANTVTTVDHNRIANLTNGTGIIRGIAYSSSSNNPVCHIRFNKIFGLSTNSVTAGYAGGSIVGQGIYFFPTGYTRNCQISDNTIHTIKANSTTAATNVSGITATNFDGTISRNVVYNIQNASTIGSPVPATANGFLFRFLENALISNNMVSLTGNVSDSVQRNGILITGANGGLQAYVNNSVNVSNATGNPVSSFAFHRGENSTTTQSYQPVAMKNNIFFNGVTSPGNHYSIGSEGARPDSSWIIAENDYNNFHSITPGTTTLWGTTPGDIASWKTLSGGDPHSVSQFVQYQDPLVADLHLAGASLGDFVLAGTPVAEVTTDIDGEARHATYPYMGADESVSSPLPVTLTSFNAKRNGKKDVWVYWSTASETNADRFIVEASANGKDFKYVGTVKAKGQSVSLTHYQLTHYDAKADMSNSNIIYYRLKTVDRDGSTATSQIVRVLFDKEEMTLDGTSAFPNPFTGNITLSIPSNRSAKVAIEIMDLQGRSIRSTQEQLTEGINHINVSDLDNLDTGIYFVKVSVNGDQQVIKMIKR